MSATLESMREGVLVGMAGGRIEHELEHVRSGVLRFLDEQFKLRGIVGISLGGGVKDERGYPDVVFGMRERGYAVWVDLHGEDESAECRHMREKMTGGWKCYRVVDKSGVLDMLGGR